MRLVASLLVASAGIASAQPPGLVPSSDQPPKLVASYHRQTLIADGIGFGLVAAGAALDSSNGEGLALLGAGTYLFGAPLVHLHKLRYGHAGVSFGLRIALPLAGMFIGHSINSERDCDPEWLDCSMPSYGQMWGTLAGVALAIAHDSIFLADGDDPPEPAPRMTPTFRATHGGLALGVGGSF